jgi:general secretion pathway protein G
MTVSLMRRSRSRNSRGFSAVELLIVVTIILIIAAIAIPNLISAIYLAKVARAVSEIANIEEAVDLYQSINNVLPDNLSQVGYANLLDPWGDPYEYVNHATGHGNGSIRLDNFNVPLNADFDLYSVGKDRMSSDSIAASDSQDDVLRASDGSYKGLASQF